MQESDRLLLRISPVILWEMVYQFWSIALKVIGIDKRKLQFLKKQKNGLTSLSRELTELVTFTDRVHNISLEISTSVAIFTYVKEINMLNTHVSSYSVLTTYSR